MRRGGWIWVCLIAIVLALGAVHAAAEPLAPGAPVIEQVGNENRLTWSGVPGATRYAVYRSAKPVGGFKRIGYAAEPMYVHKKAGTPSFYKVCAMTGKAKGPFSPITGAIAAPKDVRVSLEGGRFTLHWKEAKFATGYKVEVSDAPNGAFVPLKESVTGTSYDVTDVATTTRYFRVVSGVGDNYSGASSAVGVFEPVKQVSVERESTFLAGPTNRVNVTWNASIGADGYEVYRCVLPDTRFEKLGYTTETYYPDIAPETQLCAYQVRPIYAGRAGALSDAVTMWSGMEDNVPVPDDVKSSTGIVLLVNKKAQITTAYGQDASGKYTVVLRHMLCSTGKVYERTANGKFTIQPPIGEWKRYPSGVYVRYPSVYRNGYYFHSPLYSAGKKIMSYSISRLGTRQSLGCIRLTVNDAKWIYEKCPVGTKVYICDGGARASLKKAIKPKNVTVKGF